MRDKIIHGDSEGKWLKGRWENKAKNSRMVSSVSRQQSVAEHWKHDHKPAKQLKFLCVTFSIYTILRHLIT